jgi:hypothetical protein
MMDTSPAWTVGPAVEGAIEGTAPGPDEWVTPHHRRIEPVGTAGAPPSVETISCVGTPARRPDGGNNRNNQYQRKVLAGLKQ